ncbi:MAG: alpha/beta hydrolase [Verrucomicrobiota bacterium]|nr:alpha/beta hydrolase [Verrucomicrobiota bacterium]
MAFRILISLLVVLGGTGCAGPGAPLACPQRTIERSARIFYATDRQKLASDNLAFGSKRTDPPGLHMGWERVALGAGHRLGKVDAAITITPAHEQTESPGAALTDALQHSDADISAFVETQLRSAIREAARSRGNSRPQVLLFVHGYNTDFDWAVRNTAQLAGDLELVTCSGQVRGVAIAYSWPAQNTLLSYLADEENAEWTQQRLAPFVRAISRVCRQQGAELTLIAHSMGARALVRSLAYLANASEPAAGSERLADHVILLAPDIGKGLFDQYVERFLPLVHHLTIYVSAKDHALGLSSLLHGGHSRLGLIGSTVLAALELTGLRHDDHRDLASVAYHQGHGKVDMIDVTGSVASQFGHSYEDPAFIRDLHELIDRGTPAGAGARANLERRQVRPGLFRNVAALSYFQLRK